MSQTFTYVLIAGLIMGGAGFLIGIFTGFTIGWDASEEYYLKCYDQKTYQHRKKNNKPKWKFFNIHKKNKYPFDEEKK